MSDPTNRPHDDDADTVPIDPDLAEPSGTAATAGATTNATKDDEGTNRVVNDPDEGTYTDVDLPDDEPTAGAGTA